MSYNSTDTVPITDDDQSDVKEYFLRSMSEYDWEFVGEQSHDGKYGFKDALTIVNPFTKYLSSAQAKVFNKIVPPLNMKGSMLQFQEGARKCYIGVYTFPGALDIMKNVPVEMEPVKRYGNTLIAVYYFYDET